MKNCIIYLLALLLAAPVSARAESLPDVSGHENETAIRYLYNKEIISGYPDGSYQPSRSVNRAEFTKIIVGAKLDGANPTHMAADCFPDVKRSDWFASYVCYAKENGIIEGYPDGTFRPANDINLAEAAKIIVNTLEITQNENTGGAWYEVFIRSLQDKGAVPTSFSAVGQKVNRGQMAEILYRLMEKIQNLPSKTLVSANISSGGYTVAGGTCSVPSEGQPEDSSSPDHVVGNGTPASCTSEAFIDAVAQGGVITFNCGSDPVTIGMNGTAKIVNDTGPEIVIDGGGKVTLDGRNKYRILYMNTCDPNQTWTTSHCQNQDHPRLTVQNLTFVNGNSKGEMEYEGGGAIWVRGGRFKVINSSFFNNVAANTGPDVGGGAIRVLSQYEDQPVYVVNSTFGGQAGKGNSASNGGALSSIGVSWNIINSLFSYNRATGNGGNPAQSGTPGGGSGGAIYNDGNTMTLSLCGTEITQNEVNAYGAAIFFVTNDHSGNIRIEDSHFYNNIGGSWYILPGISMHDDTRREVINSAIE